MCKCFKIFDWFFKTMTKVKWIANFSNYLLYLDSFQGNSVKFQGYSGKNIMLGRGFWGVFRD